MPVLRDVETARLDGRVHQKLAAVDGEFSAVQGAADGLTGAAMYELGRVKKV